MSKLPRRIYRAHSTPIKLIKRRTNRARHLRQPFCSIRHYTNASIAFLYIHRALARANGREPRGVRPSTRHSPQQLNRNLLVPLRAPRAHSFLKSGTWFLSSLFARVLHRKDRLSATCVFARVPRLRFQKLMANWKKGGGEFAPSKGRFLLPACIFVGARFHSRLSFEKLIRETDLQTHREKIEWCFFRSLGLSEINAAKIAAGSLPRRARCIPPANSKNECGRQGEKFIESRPPVLPPKAFPVNRCAGPSFQTDLYKSCLSLRALSGWATVLLPPPSPPFPLHESLKVHREAGNRRCLLLFRRGSPCHQLEARVGKVDELFCIYPVRWLGGSLGGSSGILK